MHLSSVSFDGVRNLDTISLECHAKANIIYGSNGSGKTSFLEAVFLLGRGRSFKHRDLRLVIGRGAEQLIVSGRLSKPDSNSSYQLGVSRSLKGGFEARCNGQNLASAAELAAELPIQLVDAHSFSLLEGGPLQRRQFIDWGVFHVEHSFANLWKRFQKALKQRNQLLRHVRIDEESLALWSNELAPLSEMITKRRKEYLTQLEPYISPLVRALKGLGEVSLEYNQGWQEGASLLDVFSANKDRDVAIGTTSHGAQRADVKLYVDGELAADSLSRGQSKLLVYALKLAQAAHFKAATGNSCVFLLDDLPAELDADNCRDVLDYLNSLGCQYFVTGVDKEDFEGVAKEGAKLFHVEHGVISNV
jgi:DNA replication and repair protein RecF